MIRSRFSTILVGLVILVLTVALVGCDPGNEKVSATLVPAPATPTFVPTLVPSPIPTLAPIEMFPGTSVSLPQLNIGCGSTGNKLPVQVDTGQLTWTKTISDKKAIKLKGGYTLKDGDEVDINFCNGMLKLGWVEIGWTPLKVVLHPYADPIVHAK